ncbi:MAG: flagellar basal body-associated protein FliL [Burkholderiales bacterium]|nr:flagellar basal body-associated protein FliL [Burkholderiales bacterium]
MAKDDKAKAAPGGARKDEPAAAPPKQKKGRTLVMAIAALAVLAAGGGGAGWWFLREAPAATDAAKGAGVRKPPERPKAVLYVPLETFTVNLQPENGEHFLQTTLSLRVADSATEQAIKQFMPDIRSRLVLLLSSKKPSDLATIDGKQGLANQIAGEVNTVLDPGAARPAGKPAPAPAAQPAPADAASTPAAPAPAPAPEPQGPVLSVLFTNFIIQ